MEVQTKTNTYLILSTVLTVLLFGFCLFVYFDLENNRITRIRELNESIRNLEYQKGQSLSMSYTINKSRDARNSLNMFFITRSTAGAFIQELESLAKKADVTMTLDAPTVEKEKMSGKDLYLKMNLRAEGTFNKVFYFLTLIEALPYKIRIVNTHLDMITTEGTKTRTWDLETSFDLMSYIDN